MAVDTAAKRFSMMNFSDGVQVPMLPDGTVGQGDKQHLLDCYAGIAFSNGAAPAPAQRSRSIYTTVARSGGL